MSTHRDVDYLTLSTRIHGLIDTHLTRERMERFLTARDDQEAGKVLEECGYIPFNLHDAVEMDKAISMAERETFEDMAAFAPDPKIVDIFRIPYDYHNAKALLKERATGVSAEHMLMRNGRIDPEDIRKAIDRQNEALLPEILSHALREAAELFGKTDDPQLAEVILDRATYEETLSVARETGSDFLIRYIILTIDSMNLRSLVRALRMGKNAEFLENVLINGGEIGTEQILSEARNGGTRFAELYRPTHFYPAAKEGEKVLLEGGNLDVFEKLGDDAEREYFRDANLKAFGEEVLIGYLAARQVEYRNVRIMLLGRNAGLQHEQIRRRLRDAYE